MEIKSLYLLLIGLVIMSVVGCDQKKDEVEIEEKGTEYQSKTFDCEMELAGYLSDTIITVADFFSDIEIIQNNTDWLDVEAAYSITNAYQVKVTCYKNTSSCVRYAEVSVFCKNGDCLKIKVKQNVITGLEDVHNNVSDQPALSPLR